MVLILLIGMTATQAFSADFCWKDSTPRGAGTIPTGCPAGRTNYAGLCYTNCKAGYVLGDFGVCSQKCPVGYVSSGIATCHYDKKLTRDGTWQCTERGLFGECWWSVLRCPTGYTNAGLFCALTIPPMPAGFTGTASDPIRATYTQRADDPGRIPNGCGAAKTIQAGLCYTACAANMKGVGPVCWGNTPTNWVACGAGAASSSAKCGEQVFDQVTSVGALALDIATGGAGSAATAPTKAAKLAKLKTAYAAAKAANPKYVANAKKMEQAYDYVDKTRTSISVLDNATGGEQMTEEELLSMSAAIASLTPGAIGSAMGVVSSYSAPVCSKVFPDQKLDAPASAAAAPAAKATHTPAHKKTGQHHHSGKG